MANQGIYHPTYNPNGSKKLSDGNFWYNTAISINSTMDCFDSSKMLANSGNIGTTSGRPDGIFYDQIAENSILDLRNSSKKPEDYNRLISREFNKLVAGTTRGKEGEWTNVLNGTFTATASSSSIFYFTTIQPSWWTTSASGTAVYDDNIEAHVIFAGNGYRTKSRLYSSGSGYGLILGVPITVGQSATIVVSVKSTRTKSNTLLHCDIIGNPTNYPTAWKQNGVFGTPLIVAEDGTSLLPDGAKDSFKLSRKANATPLLCLRSTDNGTTWISFTPTFSTTTNAITLTDEPAGNLVMVYYQTHTSMAVPVANSEVLEIGEVWAGNSQYTTLGNTLVNSLIGKTPVGTTAPAAVFNGKSIGYKFYNTPIEKFDVATEYKPNHTAIGSLGTTASPTCKVFPYLTRTNGKAYLNLVFKEMKYGSYLAPTVVTAASTTYTQNMLYKINIAGCTLDGKVIKWVDNTYTGVLDWSLYDVNISGKIYKISDGSIHVNSKLYDGDSWGDDAKFNIVDNVSTTTDDNGQTVLIGQKTVELPYFIAGDE